MKKKYIQAIAILLFSSGLFAEDCSQLPDGQNLEKSLKEKAYEHSESLLKKFKSEVKIYLKTCDKSKDMFEQMSVHVLTYEDTLADIKHDLANKKVALDCSAVPSSSNLEDAFKAKKDAQIEALYTEYTKNAKDYIEHCASHVEYESVFESSMFCDEMYDEWKTK